MCRMVISFDRSVFAEEAEKIEDALVRTLHEMNLNATVYDEITENTTTTGSYAERITKDDKIMYDILIDLYVGEHGYSEHIYYFGTFDEARRYANSYLDTIWGEGDETKYDDIDEFYTSKNEERSAQLGNITPFKLTAMTEKGTLPFKARWSIA